MLVNTRFQVLFHSPPGVLFTFPSQYCSTIGHWVVFWLGGWAPRVPCGFHVSAGTPDTARPVVVSFTWLSHSSVALPNAFYYDSVSKCGPYPKNISTLGLAFSAFARHYSRNLGWLLFLRLLRCFSSAGSLRIPMDSVYGLICCHMRGFPIRISADISAICASPRLFAACHVLLRLPMPRHSPCALSSLNFFEWSLNVLYINLIFCSCMSFANRCILSYAFLSLNCICFTLILGKTFFISWLDLKKFLSV